MNKSNFVDPVNEQVIKLWENTFNSDSDYGPSWYDEVFSPLICPPMNQDVVIFIGLNPSFSERIYNTAIEYLSSLGITDLKEFYYWRNHNFSFLKKAQNIEAKFREIYPYFKKFQEIADYTSTEWEHIDLFFYRETNQNIFKEKVYTNKHLTGFVRSQLDLSKELILKAKPKVIVVVNAFASNILKKEFKLEYAEEHGYHTTRLNNQLVPVFLGSMLSGQRAMDVYSYQRLKWHINKALRLHS